MDKLGNITLYNADCMDIMRQMPDNAFDLAIVDPPYGIGGDSLPSNRSNKKKRLCGAGKLRNRILNMARTDWDVAPTQEYFDELFRVSREQIIWGGNYFDLPPTRGIICWDKQQPWTNFSQFELAWTSFDRPAAMFRHRNAGDGEKKIHPTQKPVALYKWLLANYAKEGDRILDTHGGSMSSAIAAYDGMFEMTIIEKDKEYYDAAKRRLQWHMMQQKLF